MLELLGHSHLLNAHAGSLFHGTASRMSAELAPCALSVDASHRPRSGGNEHRADAVAQLRHFGAAGVCYEW